MSIPKPFWQLLTEDPARSWSLSIYTTSAQLAYLPRHGRNPEDAAQGSVSKCEVCSIKCIYEAVSLGSWLAPCTSLTLVCVSFDLSGITTHLFFPWAWLALFYSERSGETGKAHGIVQSFQVKTVCSLSPDPLPILHFPLLHFLPSLLPLSLLHPAGQAFC